VKKEAAHISGIKFRYDPFDPDGGIAVVTISTQQNTPLGAGQHVTVRPDADHLEVHRWFGPGGRTKREAHAAALRRACEVRDAIMDAGVNP